MSEAIEHIAKEAGILRAYLKNGKVDITKLDNFLARVEAVASTRNQEKHKVDRLNRQLLSLEGKQLKKVV
jgi:hypothetical protein